MRELNEIEKLLCNHENNFNPLVNMTCQDAKKHTKHLPHPFNEKLQVVNGIDCRNGAIACGQENCHEFELLELVELQRRNILNTISEQSKKEYTTGRGLNGRESYNSELNLVDGGIQSLFEEYVKNHHHTKMDLFDVGCGSGFAHKQIQELQTINNVIGVSLPVGGEIYGKNVLFANALNITGKNFEASMSVHGFTCYNPYGKIYNGFHSVARLINSTKIGGLYFDSEGNSEVATNKSYGDMLNLLVKEGIIKHSELAQSLAKSDKEKPPIFEVILHLTIDRIKSIMDTVK